MLDEKQPDKKKMVSIWLIGLIALCPTATRATRKNVLFLMSDDLRPQLGAYEGSRYFPSPVSPKMHTPNIDKLASSSLLARRAYCQQAICSPSRTSMLTGRRPDTTHVYDLKTNFRDVGGADWSTMPQYFKDNGYYSVGMGKLFHPGKASGYDDDSQSWSEPVWHAPAHGGFWGDENALEKSWFAANASMIDKHGPLIDQEITSKAVETIERLAKSVNDQPFFLAVGLNKPHLPFSFPEEFLDLYQTSDINLPKYPYAPSNMPDIAWYYNYELRRYADIKALGTTGDINTTLPDSVVLALRRAYYAATSYADDNIGKILDELERQGLSENTIVSFVGDHGYTLGEHGAWGKSTNFEAATHIPFMIRAPGMTDEGKVTDRFVELVDLFPTLVELTGLHQMIVCPEYSTNVEVCTEGVSLVPLMKNANHNWKDHAFSQYPREEQGVMGYTVRTDRYRYTEWPEFYGEPLYMPNWNILHGEELYDHKTDPYENKNRADDPEMWKVKKKLRKILRRGWRG